MKIVDLDLMRFYKDKAHKERVLQELVGNPEEKKVNLNKTEIPEIIGDFFEIGYLASIGPNIFRKFLLGVNEALHDIQVNPDSFRHMAIPALEDFKQYLENDKVLSDPNAKNAIFLETLKNKMIATIDTILHQIDYTWKEALKVSADITKIDKFKIEKQNLRKDNEILFDKKEIAQEKLKELTSSLTEKLEIQERHKQIIIDSKQGIIETAKSIKDLKSEYKAILSTTKPQSIWGKIISKFTSNKTKIDAYTSKLVEALNNKELGELNLGFKALQEKYGKELKDLTNDPVTNEKIKTLNEKIRELSPKLTSNILNSLADRIHEKETKGKEYLMSATNLVKRLGKEAKAFALERPKLEKEITHANMALRKKQTKIDKIFTQIKDTQAKIEMMEKKVNKPELEAKQKTLIKQLNEDIKNKIEALNVNTSSASQMNAQQELKVSLNNSKAESKKIADIEGLSGAQKGYLDMLMSSMDQRIKSDLSIHINKDTKKTHILINKVDLKKPEIYSMEFDISSLIGKDFKYGMQTPTVNIYNTDFNLKEDTHVKKDYVERISSIIDVKKDFIEPYLNSNSDDKKSYRKIYDVFAKSKEFKKEVLDSFLQDMDEEIKSKISENKIVSKKDQAILEKTFVEKFAPLFGDDKYLKIKGASQILIADAITKLGAKTEQAMAKLVCSTIVVQLKDNNDITKEAPKKEAAQKQKVEPEKKDAKPKPKPKPQGVRERLFAGWF